MIATTLPSTTQTSSGSYPSHSLHISKFLILLSLVTFPQGLTVCLPEL